MTDTSAPVTHAIADEASKPWWASQTIWGGISAIGAGAAGAWLAWRAGNIEAAGAALTAIFAGIQAIIGRVRADTSIRK